MTTEHMQTFEVIQRIADYSPICSMKSELLISNWNYKLYLFVHIFTPPTDYET